MPFRIEVSNLRPVPNSGAVRAFADVDIGGKLTVYGCKVVQDGDKRPWVAMPDRSYEGPDGKTRYAPHVKIEDETLRTAVTTAVLAAWGGGQS
jgi:DNA-binding cell septation regulator SpoVG